MARLGRIGEAGADMSALPALPSGKIVLVMDGNCALCSLGARTIARSDSDDVCRIATVQSPTGRALLKHFRLDPEDPWSWLALVEGEALTSSDAIIAVGKRLSLPWRALVHVGSWLPRGPREWAYRVVARNRYAWFGRNDLCAIPDPRLRARLIDS